MQRSRPRSVKSALNQAPVDAHERTRDYLTEAEFLVLLQGTRRLALPLAQYRHAPADFLSWAACLGAL